MRKFVADAASAVRACAWQVNASGAVGALRWARALAAGAPMRAPLPATTETRIAMTTEWTDMEWLLRLRSRAGLPAVRKRREHLRDGAIDGAPPLLFRSRSIDGAGGGA